MSYPATFDSVSYTNLSTNCQVTNKLFLATENISPLAFWKEREAQFPRLSAIARDILAIPATGLAVERLFNIGRDVCNYRRSHLTPDTIRELMFKFYLDKKQATEIQQAQQDKSLADSFPTEEELQAEVNERRSAMERAWKKQYIYDASVNEVEPHYLQQYRTKQRRKFSQKLSAKRYMPAAGLVISSSPPSDQEQEQEQDNFRVYPALLEDNQYEASDTSHDNGWEHAQDQDVIFETEPEYEPAPTLAPQRERESESDLESEPAPEREHESELEPDPEDSSYREELTLPSLKRSLKHPAELQQEYGDVSQTQGDYPKRNNRTGRDLVGMKRRGEL